MGFLPFKISEYKSRLEKVRQAMDEKRIDGLLVTTTRNLYYLTGFRVGPGFYHALVIPRDGEPIGVARCLEESAARQTSWVKNWKNWKDAGDPYMGYLNPTKATSEAIIEANLQNKKIGIETRMDDATTQLRINHLTIHHFEQLKKQLPNARFVDDGSIVDKLRVIKSPAEIRFMKRATRIVETAMLSSIEYINEGQLENDVFAEAMKTGYKNAECSSFDARLDVGEESTLSHLWGRMAGKKRVIKKGDVIWLEYWATVALYVSPKTRTISIGKPSSKLLEAADVSIKGIETAIRTMRPGVTSGEVDRACREEFNKKGLGKYFLHRTGYSIGIGWGEGGILSLRSRDDSVLKPGMVFHLVPGFFSPELRFGVSISECVLVTKQGSEILSAGKLERKLYVR
jgi:Xaa-Pro aminopeptidase